METASWILVIILASFLAIFLALSIILVVKLIKLTNEAKKIVITSQGIASKADDIVDSVKDMTSIGGLVKKIVNSYTKHKPNK